METPEYNGKGRTDNNCFEPTYKEWKLGGKNGEKEEKVGFEPTYKEWKP